MDVWCSECQWGENLGNRSVFQGYVLSRVRADNLKPVARSSEKICPILKMKLERDRAIGLQTKEAVVVPGKEGQSRESEYCLSGGKPAQQCARYTGDPVVPFDLIRALICSGAGDGSCITSRMDPGIELVTPRSISHTRSG